MFTPPASPQPLFVEKGSDPMSPMAEVETNSLTGRTSIPSQKIPELKRRVGRKTKWTVLAVPLVLILITASTRYITHPIVFDAFSDPPPLSADWRAWTSRLTDWTPHKRHLAVDSRLDVASESSSASASIAFPSSTLPSESLALSTATPTSGTSSDTQDIPTVPDSTPVLPTPFPQPFDTLAINFSSVTCYNFILNMTNTAPFRSCRPFSLLLSTSNEFIQAQSNLTELNAIVWGTCNTTLSEDQCDANMAWFASELQTACVDDLTARNSQAVNALTGLQSYSLMRKAGCLQDPTTDTYCYVAAVHNTNPSDTYFYELPLDISLPSSTEPTCSACSQSLMTLYADSLENSTEAPMLQGLQNTYPNASRLAVASCGTSYAQVIGVTSGALPFRRNTVSAMGAAAVLLGGVILEALL